MENKMSDIAIFISKFIVSSIWNHQTNLLQNCSSRWRAIRLIITKPCKPLANYCILQRKGLKRSAIAHDIICWCLPGGNSYCCRTEDTKRTEKMILRRVYIPRRPFVTVYPSYCISMYQPTYQNDRPHCGRVWEAERCASSLHSV